MIKVLFVSSAGGHFAELNKLSLLMENFESIIVTEKVPFTTKHKVDYYLKYGSRNQLFRYIYIFLCNMIKTYKIIKKERPNVIVSTGAHTAVSFFYIAKLFKIKLIYIESFAKVNSSSLTYKLIKKKADIIIVQHEEMILLYPNSICLEGVY